MRQYIRLQAVGICDCIQNPEIVRRCCLRKSAWTRETKKARFLLVGVIKVMVAVEVVVVVVVVVVVEVVVVVVLVLVVVVVRVVGGVVVVVVVRVVGGMVVGAVMVVVVVVVVMLYAWQFALMLTSEQPYSAEESKGFVRVCHRTLKASLKQHASVVNKKCILMN